MNAFAPCDLAVFHPGSLVRYHGANILSLPPDSYGLYDRGENQLMSKIAVLGPKGTFSDSAYQAYCRKSSEALIPCYYSTIDETFHAVGKECGFGIVPVENTLDGYVQRSLDLLLEMNLHILTELTVPVQFSLAANAAGLEDIKTLYVQFKSSGQCRRAIDRLAGIRLVITESNMESFYKLKEGKQGEAAIIPQHMFRREEWEFGLENVTDSANNVTRFLVIQPGESQTAGAMEERIKVPLYVMPAFDEPGVLFQILKIFNDNRINLVSIMSRPTKKNMGTYNFYLELSGEKGQWEKIKEAVEQVQSRFPVKILGVYSVL